MRALSVQVQMAFVQAAAASCGQREAVNPVRLDSVS